MIITSWEQGQFVVAYELVIPCHLLPCFKHPLLLSHAHTHIGAENSRC